MKAISIAVPIFWTLIVIVLHIMPVRLTAESDFQIPFADKVVHFSMFASLSFLCMRSLKFNLGNLKNQHFIFILICCIAFGGVMEILQGYTSTKRDSDILDWFADVAGTAAGLLFGETKFLSFLFRHQIRKTT